MSKFIIIEGTDNTGKDTQQNLIIEKVNNLVFHKVHYSALPFKDDKAKHINIIFNRSHLGESVYAPLYRGYSGDFIFDIEEPFVNKLREELYLITLVNDPSIIMSRDDGKSFYGNEEEIKAECDGFTRAHRLSKIKNKMLVNVGKMDAEEVSNVILEFLTHENKVFNNEQLNLFA